MQRHRRDRLKQKNDVYIISVGTYIICYTMKRKKNIARCVLVSAHSSDVFISYGRGVDQKRVKGISPLESYQDELLAG